MIPASSCVIPTMTIAPPAQSVPTSDSRALLHVTSAPMTLLLWARVPPIPRCAVYASALLKAPPVLRLIRHRDIMSSLIITRRLMWTRFFPSCEYRVSHKQTFFCSDSFIRFSGLWLIYYMLRVASLTTVSLCRIPCLKGCQCTCICMQWWGTSCPFRHTGGPFTN